MNAEGLSIELGEEMRVSALLRVPDDGLGVGIVLGHGAGTDMTSPFMVAFAEGLAARGFTTLCFNFPYKERGRRLPDPGSKLERTFRAVTDHLRSRPGIKHLLIGGKSMGGRIASLSAAHGLACDGLVFLGYPLHAAGKTVLRDCLLYTSDAADE